MKRTLSMITLAVLTIGLLGSCAKINERLDNLEKKVDGIENEEIATVESQIASINSSISDLESIRQKVQAMSDPATGLSKRIEDLKTFVNDELSHYATKDWAKATLVTMEEYEKTCDTVVKIAARVEGFDSSLKACADSLKGWVNGKFGGYYDIATIDAKLAELQAQVDGVDSLSAELAKTRAEIDTAKSAIRAEYRAAITSAIETSEGKLTQALRDSIDSVNATIGTLTGRVDKLETDVAALNGRIGNLGQMIQTVTIVPAYNDGSLKIVNDSLYLDCIIDPAEVVDSLKQGNFSLLVNKVATRAVVLDTVKSTEIECFSKDTTSGTVSFRVRIGDYMPRTGDSAIAVAVNVTYRHSVNLTSNYTTSFVKAGFDLRLLLKEMLYNLADTRQNNYRMIDMMIGGELGGHIATVNTPGNSGNYSTYNPRLELIDIPFNTIMTQIYNNFPRIKDITGGTGVAYQWARILRIMATHRLSDIYGPVPYRQVTGSSYNVLYDTMGDLYTFMFEELTEAIDALDAIVKSGAENDVIAYLAPIDNIYQGDFGKWVKFANSFRLRMAMRLTEVEPQTTKYRFSQIVNSSYGLLESAEESAWCTPYEGENPICRAAQSGEFRISGNLTAYMNGYQDPRLPIYATKASASGDADKYVGVRNGAKYDPDLLAARKQLSNINVGAQDRLLVMSASEVWFLRAEAAALGYASASAESSYNNGIRVSMQERGVQPGGFEAYITADIEANLKYESATCPGDNYSNPISVPGVKITGEKNTDIQKIMIQKWIANFPNGWETWADIRRTGYPKFFPVKDNLSLTDDYGTGKVDEWSAFCRVPFPRSQYLENETNVKDAVNNQLSGRDSTTTRLWWDTH